jgi:hypothetical protein
MASARVQETLEHFAENESLLADLTDRSATAVLAWITRQVEAADAAVDDAAFDQQVTAIRRAAREAASAATRGLEEESPAAVIARAESILRSTGDPALVAAPQTPDESPPAAGVVDQEPPAMLGVAEAAPAVPVPPSPAPHPSTDPAALLRRAPIPRPAAPVATHESASGGHEPAQMTHTSSPQGHESSPRAHESSAMTHAAGSRRHESAATAHESSAAGTEDAAAPRRSFWNRFRRRWRSRKD